MPIVKTKTISADVQSTYTILLASIPVAVAVAVVQHVQSTMRATMPLECTEWPTFDDSAKMVPGYPCGLIALEWP